MSEHLHQTAIVTCAFASRPQHLDIDFTSEPQPQLVTRVLVGCLDRATGADEAGVTRWSLGRRLQALLAITIRTRGHQVTLAPQCENPDCGARFEIPLDLRLFADDEPPQQDFDTEICGRRVTLRIPNGEDQLRWLARAAVPDPATLARDMVRAVDGEVPGGDWQVPHEWLPLLGEALDRRDRLTALQLSTRCPDCDRAQSVELDLERQLLALLAACQRQLLEDIHYLARAYHWTERDVLELPPLRRAFYLRRLREEAGL